nr:hypothetical protein [Tanacetum cinerariifolium]
MRRIGIGFSGVIPPLFHTMMVQAAADIGDIRAKTRQPPIVDQPSTSRPQKKKNLGGNRGKRQRKSRSGRLRRLMKIGSGRRVKTPLEKDSLDAQEDASKHGRMIEEIDQDDEIVLDADT